MLHPMSSEDKNQPDPKVEEPSPRMERLCRENWFERFGKQSPPYDRSLLDPSPQPDTLSPWTRS